MAQDQNHLIWLDMEMTGLEPGRDRIIEIAAVITDAQLNVVAEAPVIAVHQPDEVLDAMDEWNRNTHGKSGLIERVRASTVDEAAAEQQMLAFLQEWVPARTSPMCGNSVCQDRRFMARYMPELEAWFHYRNLDVSTLKELARVQRRPEKGFARSARRHSRIDRRTAPLPRQFPAPGMSGPDEHASPTRVARALAWWRGHWRRVLVIALVVVFFYLLGYFTPQVSTPGMCLIYG
jgi:oligoribonuclease